MTSCTIIVSHFESLPFLRACIRQIRKFENKDILQIIYIIDQSSKETFIEIDNEFGDSDDIELVWVEPLYSGYGIDWAMRYGYIDTDYICQIHADAYPIHRNWLSLPISLIEENNLSFVGQLHFYTYPTDTIYPLKNPFFSMSPTFNVAKTETYKEMSLEAGFTRFHNRPQSGLTFLNDDWDKWADDDYENKGSDDDVVAFHWNGKYKTDNMLGLAISGFIEPSYCRLIDDLVFHFGSCREAIGVMGSMPELYRHYTKKINENYSDELIEEMVQMAKKNKPNGSEILSRNFWDGTLKQSSPPSEELNRRIEELKGNVGCQNTEWEVKEKFTVSMTDAEIQEMNKRIEELKK